MKGKRYSPEEKVRILRDVDAGKSIVDICREKNISDVTYHRWRKLFGHMNLNEAKRLKELERSVLWFYRKSSITIAGQPLGSLEASAASPLPAVP
jgi:putative transposase